MARALLVTLLCAFSLAGVVASQPPKGKELPKKAAKDKAPPKEKEKIVLKEVTGMFKTKDLAKKTLTLTVDGKERVFRVTEETRIVGPRGGERDLKDDVLDKGYKITVIYQDKTPDDAKEIKLPFANEREGSKPKDKSKEKEKKA